MHQLIAILVLTIGSTDQPKIDRYARADLLLEPSELVKPDVAKEFRILDARPKSDYQTSHIPNAVWVDHDAWSKTFAKEQDAKQWQELIGRLGINIDTPVVIYDDQSTNRAARIWWILRYWGIRDVKLLNGGWKAWTTPRKGLSAAPNAFTKEVPKVDAVEISLSPHPQRLATKVQLLKSLPKHEFQIIDARSESEYCGEADTAKRNGAIPGAIHKEWTEVIDKKTQRFKSPQELAELFEEAGIKLDQPSVTYCQSGGRAAVMAFALELMGAEYVRNYYRSWSEWGNAEDTRIEKPRAK
jgi:thiosulfate/3-mercaptopyruvate sulfurtransferase